MLWVPRSALCPLAERAQTLFDLEAVVVPLLVVSAVAPAKEKGKDANCAKKCDPHNRHKRLGTACIGLADSEDFADKARFCPVLASMRNKRKNQTYQEDESSFQTTRGSQATRFCGRRCSPGTRHRRDVGLVYCSACSALHLAHDSPRTRPGRRLRGGLRRRGWRGRRGQLHVILGRGIPLPDIVLIL